MAIITQVRHCNTAVHALAKHLWAQATKQAVDCGSPQLLRSLSKPSCAVLCPSNHYMPRGVTWDPQHAYRPTQLHSHQLGVWHTQRNDHTEKWQCLTNTFSFTVSQMAVGRCCREKHWNCPSDTVRVCVPGVMQLLMQLVTLNSYLAMPQLCDAIRHANAQV